jgi:hypothetical protein
MKMDKSFRNGSQAVCVLSQPALVSGPPKPSARWIRLGKAVALDCQA